MLEYFSPGFEPIKVKIIQAVTSYTMTLVDKIVEVALTNPAAVTLTAPNPVGLIVGRQYTVVDANNVASQYPITIMPFVSGETIGGLSSYVINTNGGSVTFHYDGSNYILDATNYNPNYQNLSVRNALPFPNFRAALGRIKTGTGRGKILMCGDSTTVGFGSNDAATGNMKPLSVPTDLANMFTVNGVPAQVNSFMGDGFQPNYTSTFDNRLTLGTGWGHSGTFVGGDSLVTTTSGTLSFAPTQPVDTFVIWYWQNLSSGTISANINGGSATTQNTLGAASLQNFTITGTLGLNTLNITRSAGTIIFILGVEAYNSAVDSLDIINAGWYGSECVQWYAMTQNGFATNPFALGQDLTTFCLGINDWEKMPSSLAIYQSDLLAMVKQAQLVSDVAIITPNPTGATASQATQQSYVNAMYAVAAAANVPIIDNFARFVSYAQANAEGEMFDTFHPNGVGYADLAANIFSTIGATGFVSAGSQGALSLNSRTFANLPAASTSTGQEYFATDVGPSGTIVISNGTYWRPVNGVAIIAQSGLAVSAGADTTEDVLATITIPAGLLATNGQLEIETLWLVTNNSNNKTSFIRFGGTSGTAYLNLVSTTVVSFQNRCIISNSNSASAQVGFATGTANSYAASGNALTTSAVNTAAATTLIISGQKANSGDTLTLERYSVKWVMP